MRLRDAATSAGAADLLSPADATVLLSSAGAAGRALAATRREDAPRAAAATDRLSAAGAAARGGVEGGPWRPAA